MQPASLRIAAALALAALVSSAAFGEHHEAEAPASGFRADLLADLDTLEEKVVSLAEAIPADKYGWAPTPEVRNTAASYVHMAQSSHRILRALGFEAPEGVDEMETAITEKAAVVEALESSFAAARRAVTAIGDDDLDSKVPFFGGEWSKRRILMLLAAHCHEHLGQAIVYARSVGVVPPWSRPRDAS